MQDAADAGGVAEGELAGLVGVGGRRRGDDGQGGGERHGDPGILFQRRPGGEDEAAVGIERAAEIGEGGDGVAEEHDAEARDQQVGGRAVEAPGEGVGQFQAGVFGFGEAGAGGLEDDGGDVDSGDAAGGADGIGECEGGAAGAAADVNDAAAGCGGGEVQQRVEHRGEGAFGAGFVGGPLLAHGAVPGFDLAGVTVGGGGLGHWDLAERNGCMR